MRELKDILCCPSCRAELQLEDGGALCSAIPCHNSLCKYHLDGFPICDGQPALIDFEASLFTREQFTGPAGAVVIDRASSRHRLKREARRLVYGRNKAAAGAAKTLLEWAGELGRRPNVLVIGGGEIGNGAEGLYEDPRVRIIGTDVYASPHTEVIADGHKLPFIDAAFDAVWVQAVLEHVLEPHVVAREAERVLKEGGFLFADTPFMQPVHEGAFDFTRFTASGHRSLFRRCELIRAGWSGGPGLALLWSIRYWICAMTRSDAAGALAVAPLFWVRLLDRFAAPNRALDGASGVYFLGRKSAREMEMGDILDFYGEVGGRRRKPSARKEMGH